LAALDVLSFKIADAWHRWGHGAGEVPVDIAVSVIQASFCGLEEISFLDCIADMVFWIERVRTLASTLPIFLINDISVAETVVLRFALVSNSLLSTKNVTDTDWVTLWDF